MNITVTVDEKSATSFEARCDQPRHDRAANDRFADLVEAVWPIKGPAALTQYAGCPDRTARAYSGGEREPSWKILRDCIRGKEGWRVLKWIMAGSTETWWAVIQHERAVYARLKSLSPTLRQIIDDCA